MVVAPSAGTVFPTAAIFPSRISTCPGASVSPEIVCTVAPDRRTASAPALSGAPAIAPAKSKMGNPPQTSDLQRVPAPSPLDVGCWMLDVGCFPASRIRLLLHAAPVAAVKFMFQATAEEGIIPSSSSAALA